MISLGDAVHLRLALVCASGTLLGGCDRDAAQVADGRILSNQAVEAVSAASLGDFAGDGVGRIAVLGKSADDPGAIGWLLGVDAW